MENEDAKNQEDIQEEVESILEQARSAGRNAMKLLAFRLSKELAALDEAARAKKAAEAKAKEDARFGTPQAIERSMRTLGELGASLKARAPQAVASRVPATRQAIQELEWSADGRFLKAKAIPASSFQSTPYELEMRIHHGKGAEKMADSLGLEIIGKRMDGVALLAKCSCPFGNSSSTRHLVCKHLAALGEEAHRNWRTELERRALSEITAPDPQNEKKLPRL